MLLWLFNRPPVHEMCPINEVTKYCKGTSPDLGYIAYCYVYNLCPSLSSLFVAQCPPGGSTQYLTSPHAIYGHPVCSCTESYAQQVVPCLFPSMTNSPRLPHRLPHGVFCSPERRPSLSVFNFPRHPSFPYV